MQFGLQWIAPSPLHIDDDDDDDDDDHNDIGEDDNDDSVPPDNMKGVVGM